MVLPLPRRRISWHRQSGQNPMVGMYVCDHAGMGYDNNDPVEAEIIGS